MTNPAAGDAPLGSRGQRSPKPALVVGVGASAGGVTALQQFFAHVRPDSAAAFVVILHLSPDHESRLAEVLQNASALPVTKVTEQVEVAGGRVYVISPKTSLAVENGWLTVAEMVRPEQRRAPIDIFFRTLAEAYGHRAAAVLLSGTGSDGTNGLKRVKEHGGLALAQDPSEAEHSDMPARAIASGLVDYVLPAAEIPSRIESYQHGLREPIAPDDTAAGPAADREAFREVLTAVRVRMGHDFSNYKLGTLTRRIERRMNVRGTATLHDYAVLIRQDRDEAPALMRELLISVTNFFRDRDAFAALEQHIVPKLFAGKTSRDQVRVWVPGCATGEEAYSIAMLLAEYAATAPVDQPAVQVFASDLDEHAIATAREGLYTDVEIVDVSEERLRRFFQKEADGYRVRRELRELVLFAHHNLIKDPPFSHLDLISCRNLLIYLNRDVQERVLETFHFALRPGGWLFLGTSESAEGRDDLFALQDKQAHIFAARTTASRVALPTEAATPGPLRVSLPRGRPAEPMLPAELHQRLLEQMAPPSIVTTEEYQIVHMSARAGEYLQITGGEPSRDLLNLARPELRRDLRTALHQAARQRSMVEIQGIAVAPDRHVTVIVRPVWHEADPARGYLLVLFDESPRSTPSPAPSVTLTSPTSAEDRRFEEELGTLKAQLRSTIEQYETHVEESRAANEELQAMNEELRSSAEELETSKEELQSVNEELSTVNQELKIKVEELALSNDDFQNLINSTQIGTLFLDRSLRVKLATPQVGELFNLRASDVGRPLSDITSHLRENTLADDARRVLERLQMMEREVETGQGRWYLMRTGPYRTGDNRIEGVVITFQDVTERRQAHERVRTSEERFRLLIDSAIDYAIFTMSPGGTVDSWNSGAERMFGFKADDIVGKSSALLYTPEDRAGGVPARELERAGHEGRASDERWHVRQDGSRFYCSGVTTRLGNDASRGFAKIARDLTQPRQSQSEFELLVQERTRDLQAQVTERAAGQESVTRLLRRLVTAQEDERSRIARDLHDQLGQQLTALRLSLERHSEQCGAKGKAKDEIDRALALAAALDAEVDFLAWELRPAALDDLGLVAALPRYVKEWSEHYGIEAECRTAGVARGHLTTGAEIVFYRIAQEALNNVVKHAHATRVDVILEQRGGEATLLVEDNGVGFDTSSAEVNVKGIGLAGMRERAALVGASLEVESTPGDGTTIFLRCPVVHDAPQQQS